MRFKIYSVKRSEDEEIFILGDRIQYSLPDARKFVGIIESFEINGNEIWAMGNPFEFRIPMYGISKTKDFESQLDQDILWKEVFKTIDSALEKKFNAPINIPISTEEKIKQEYTLIRK